MEENKIKIENYEQFIDEYSIYFYDQYTQNNKSSKEIMNLKEFAEKKCEFICPIHGKLFTNLE